MKVYVDMVADLFHSGHVNFLQTIYTQYNGNYICVGLMSDTDAENYKRLPVCTVQERGDVIASCRYVDEVIVNAPMPITEEFMHVNQIDLVIHGDDISPSSELYWYEVPIRLGKYRTIPYSPHISTSDIIQRIKERE